MSTHALQSRAPTTAAPARSALQPSRPFAAPGAAPAQRMDASPAGPLAEGHGHELGRIAVRPADDRGGLPAQLKRGIERLSGVPMDDVRVRYHSPKPAAVEAAAYTQGTEIHLAPGQHQHLAHEAWHVVQQKQGRVKPTLRVAGKPVNDDPGLEREAETMGARALGAAGSIPSAAPRPDAAPAEAAAPVQRMPKTHHDIRKN